MKNTTPLPLIIAGIGEQQLYAAAILLCQWPEAELETASAKRLPSVLEKVAKSHGRSVYIAGVPGTHKPEIIRRTVQAAAEKQNLLVWFGQEAHRPPAGTAWKEHVVPNTGTMADTVLKLASPSRETKQMQLLCAIARKIKDAAPLDSAEEKLASTAKAAYWAATELQGFNTYKSGIAFLAGKHQAADSQGLSTARKHYEEWGADRQSERHSQAMKDVYKKTWVLGKEGKCRVLITGETGTGKETIARVIHASSPRTDKPFIAFNCAELSPQLLEGKLFGYTKGAFTGANQEYHGAFERANGGTLFLDEVGELSLSAQAGLLRVLQERRFLPLGSESEMKVDVRVLAATNRDLLTMVKDGTFRADLYYRLNAVILHLPALRERKEDIEFIAWGYWKNRPTPQQLQALCSYSWPGNVRELLSILDHARIFNESDLSKAIPHEETVSGGMPDESLESAIRTHVCKIHARYDQNHTRAAKALGISINTLRKYRGIAP